MVTLKIDFCSHEAAKFACEHWHYSKCVPHQKIVKLGVWEDNRFIGVILFGDGANNNAFSPYGLSQTEGCELVRVALDSHQSTVSQIVSLAIKRLKRQSPNIKIIISFADPEQNHHGGIYQAGNWIYLGKTLVADEYIVNGKRMHGRALRSTRSTHRLKNISAKNILEWTRKVLDKNARQIDGSSKHRYVYPLDRKLAKELKSIALPYPKKRAND